MEWPSAEKFTLASEDYEKKVLYFDPLKGQLAPEFVAAFQGVWVVDQALLSEHLYKCWELRDEIETDFLRKNGVIQWLRLHAAQVERRSRNIKERRAAASSTAQALAQAFNPRFEAAPHRTSRKIAPTALNPNTYSPGSLEHCKRALALEVERIARPLSKHIEIIVIEELGRYQYEDPAKRRDDIKQSLPDLNIALDKLQEAVRRINRLTKSELYKSHFEKTIALWSGINSQLESESSLSELERTSPQIKTKLLLSAIWHRANRNEPLRKPADLLSLCDFLGVAVTRSTVFEWVKKWQLQESLYCWENN